MDGCLPGRSVRRCLKRESGRIGPKERAMLRTGRFLREDRLLDSRDYRRVMRSGRRRAGPDLVVFFVAKPEEPLKHPRHPKSPKDRRKVSPNRDLGIDFRSRIGITVSRKVGNAVVRNRFKRRVRAWFRERREELGASLGLAAVDLVVIARNSGGRLSRPELDESLGRLLGLEVASHPASKVGGVDLVEQ